MNKVLLSLLSVAVLSTIPPNTAMATSVGVGAIHDRNPKVPVISSLQVSRGEVDLYAETFGNPDHPAVLLIMGSSASGMLWPDSFCDHLSQEGLFVIRYDHRDTGRSTRIDYTKKPYNIHDMAADAVAILDEGKVEAAHVVGFSMGGQIAQFIGSDHPQRVRSLTLISTSTTFEPFFQAFAGKFDEPLSPPSAGFVSWAKGWTAALATDSSLANRERYFLERWQRLTGDGVGFDQAMLQGMLLDASHSPAMDDPSRNHTKAMFASISDHRSVCAQITAPTLIIHGSHDPLFGEDHAWALQAAIPGSSLRLIGGMGHTIHSQFYEELIALIYRHILGDQH